MAPPSDTVVDDPATRSVPFAQQLASYGDRVAIITPEAAISYQDLADRVAEVATVLGRQRQVAHLLLGVAGFNLARFHLSAAAHRERLRHLGRGVVWVALASATWIAMVVLVTESYSVANVFLLHYVLGSEETRHGWHFWFIETLAYLQVALLLLLALPVVDRLAQRLAYGVVVTRLAARLWPPVRRSLRAGAGRVARELEVRLASPDEAKVSLKAIPETENR